MKLEKYISVIRLFQINKDLKTIKKLEYSFICFCIYWNPPMLNIENQVSSLITLNAESLIFWLLMVIMIRAYSFISVPITYTFPRANNVYF